MAQSVRIFAKFREIFGFFGLMGQNKCTLIIAFDKRKDFRGMESSEDIGCIGEFDCDCCMFFVGMDHSV